MFEAFVITLREGVEAALVLALSLALLERRGLQSLRGALLAGAGLALAASVAAAVLAARLTFNQELAEGLAMVAGSVLVLTLVFWMWRAAPRMKEEVERGMARATGSTGGRAAGVFLFAFVMVFREGAETALFLSAASFNSQGVALWLGAALGLVLALGFGVLFARGTLRIPLKPFFSITSAVLLLIAAQLLIGGLHELSVAELLPSSRAEMALIGPLVKNELLLFTLTVALGAGMLLFGPNRATAPAPLIPAASGPAARLERASRARDAARRRWTATLALVVVGFLATAFIRGSRLPERPPAQPVALESGAVVLDLGLLHDRHPHFYEVTLPEGAARFFAIEVDGEPRVCFDACEICGDRGYFEQGGALVCRNCASPIPLKTLGRGGGCNPIPLPLRLEGGRLLVREADLRAGLPRLKGR